jgi:hypothetical protein
MGRWEAASMDEAQWARVGEMSPKAARDWLAAMAQPAACSGAVDGLAWSLHSKMSASSRGPGGLLAASARLGNGYSATLAWGCEDRAGGGPWPLRLWLAARAGDEASGSMVACFEPGSSPPRACLGAKRFLEEAPETDVGPRSAVAESANPFHIAAALSVVAALPSIWDDPAQAGLWPLARSGSPGQLAKALADHPKWARARWSKGSSLPALCARLGRWGFAKEAAAASAEPFGRELARECALAVAAYCHDACALWPAGLGSRSLLRAWGAGLELDMGAWVDAFGPDALSRQAALGAWVEAEREWLDGCAQAAGKGAGRL